MGDFTYEHLFDVLRKERSREELQELEPDFYVRCQAYIAVESEKLRHSDVLSSSGERLRMQVQNAKKLLKELYDRREKKIMFLALNKARTGSSIIDTSSLLHAELEMYTLVLQQLTTFRDRIDGLSAQQSSALAHDHITPPRPHVPSSQPDSPAPRPEAPSSPAAPTPTVDPEGQRLRALTAIPKFLGGQNMSFGPFEQGDELSVPERIARILIKKGRAEPIVVGE